MSDDKKRQSILIGLLCEPPLHPRSQVLRHIILPRIVTRGPHSNLGTSPTSP
jgi:hypothetical protein